VLQQGGLIAHQTATVAGVAAHPKQTRAIKKLQRFKQRQGPFLLLADSSSTALKQAVYISHHLRKLAQKSWPGAVTLAFPARMQLHQACYKQKKIAVRVDADQETRRLAFLCGGLLLSSSFNRRGMATMPLTEPCRWRYSRHLHSILKPKRAPVCQAVSKIYSISQGKVTQLR